MPVRMKGKNGDGCKLVASVSKALCPESVMGLTISWLRILEYNTTLLPNPALPLPLTLRLARVSVLVPPTLLVASMLSFL